MAVAYTPPGNDTWGSTSAPPAPPVPSSDIAAHPPSVWPRTYQSRRGDTVVMYQPQVDSWKDHDKIRFRAAVVATPIGGKTDYGVVAVQGDTLVDNDARTVLITNMDVAVRFPGMADADASPL